jgi:hypothetical protein
LHDAQQTKVPQLTVAFTTHLIFFPFHQLPHLARYIIRTLAFHPRFTSNMADRTMADPVNATSIKSAHPSSMAVDRLTADLSTMVINASLPNFPIPRELRDMIYGYLLDGNYTRVQRKLDQVPQNHNHAGPNAYHLHTNILAVNQEIHDEAEELLYKANTFVVVSYQRTPLVSKMERGDLLWVPIVSKKFVNGMKLHWLRIHADPGVTSLQIARSTGTEAPTESYIILAGDIKAFAVSMHIAEENTIGTGVLVVSLPIYARPLVQLQSRVVDGATYESTRLKCQLRDTRYRAMNRDLQHDLLAPLASIIGMSKKVSFTGTICDPQQTAHLKNLMGPSLVCQDALWWSTYKDCVLAKEVADVAAEYDELELTVHLYSEIVRRLELRLNTFTEVSRDI